MSEVISFEGKHLESIEAQLWELKQKKEEEKLSKKEKTEVLDYSHCLVCGKRNFRNMNELLIHYNENHEARLGVSYSEFIAKYPAMLSKITKKLNKETQRRLELDYNAELFQRAIRGEGIPKRDDLAQKFTIPLIRKELLDLNHAIFEQHSCPYCSLTSPILDENNEPTNESIEEHVQRMHPREWRRYLDLEEASEGNLQALSEKEQISKILETKDDTDIILIKSTTENTIEKEELTKSDLPDKNLLTIFSEEVYTELSKKKQIGRKTR